MKRLCKKSLYKIFVSLFVIFYSFVPQSIALGQVIDDISAKEELSFEEEIPEESLLEEEVILPEEELPPVFEDPLFEEIPIEEPIIKTPVVNPEEVIKEVMSYPVWIIQGDTATTSDVVELGETYIAPQDSRVKIIFTRLPEESSTLKIERVKVGDLNLPEGFNTESEYAYDITTDMKNGTFEFDLTLPKPEGLDAEVIYIEKSINEAKQVLNEEDIKKIEVEKLIQEEGDDSVKVKDLDHFTIYITTYSDPSFTVEEDTYIRGDTIYVRAGDLNTDKYYKIRLDPNNSSSGNIDSSGCYNPSSASDVLTFSYLLPSTATLGIWQALLREYDRSDCSDSNIDVRATDTFEVLASLPVSNPPLPTKACGLDIALVLDVSGSIGTDELAQMKNAFIAFVDSLSGTPTQFSVTQFGTTAIVLQPFTSDYNAVKAAINSASNSGGGSIYTNWEDGLEKAWSTYDPRSDKPNLMIFSSDGNPNTVGSGPGNNASESVAVAAAVVVANSIKTNNIRILALGIGSDLDTANMIAISGTNVDTGILTSDVITSDFSELAGDLGELASKTCGGTITVKKYIDSTTIPGGSGWNFSISGGTTLNLSTSSDGTVNTGKIPAGIYSVVETNMLSGYSYGSAICKNQSGSVVGSILSNGWGSITVGNDDIVSCDFINTTNKGSITIIKDAQPNNSQDFGFTTTNLTPASFNLDDDADGTLSNTQTFNNLMPGTYTITEGSVSNWDLNSISCNAGGTVDLGSRKATIVITPGANVTCTFLNKLQTGHIIVDKVTNPSGDTQNFDFTTTGTGYNGFSLTDTDIPDDQELVAGTYSVAETAVSGWDTVSSCTSSIGDTETAASLELDPGETITCTFTNSKLSINVIKTANPTSVPETGGDVEFTIRVNNPSAVSVNLTSLSDDKFGNLNGIGSCVTPKTISAGGHYECKFTQKVFGESGGTHINKVTAVASGVSNFDDATVTFTDVAPQIRITKTGSPTSVPETGGNVTFTFLVENIGNEDVTLNSLSDTVFGNLDGKGTCDVPQTILIGGSYSCSYTVFLASDSLTAHYNVVTATAVDDDGTPATDDDNETITFADIKPTVTIDKSVTPSILAEPGGDFTFTLKIKNTSTENVNITSLVDSNALSQECLGLVGDTLVPGQEVTCSYTVSHTTVGVYDNTATVVVTDNDGSTATNFDTESVTVAGAYISFTQLLATNPINEPHTFTVTVMKNSGTGGYIPAAGETVTFSLVDNSAGATFVGGVNTCTTNLSGQCSIQINSTSPGTVDIHAYVVVNGVSGITITRQTDGSYGSSIDAVKTYQGGKIIIQKETTPNGDLQSFEFNPSWSTSNFNLSDGGSNDSGWLAPGTYSVEEIVPTGWDLTNIVCDDSDSGASVSAGNIANIVLAADETVTCTFNNTKRGSVIGQKYEDVDADGQKGTGELGLSGWTIELYNETGNGLLATTTTDAQGNYSFINILPGNYQVCEVNKNNWYNTDPGAGAATTACESITVTSGQSTIADFGNRKIGSITIVKDRISDSSESFNFGGDLGIFTLVNDGIVSNQKVFSNYAPGTYVVTETSTSSTYLHSISCTGDSDGGSNIDLGNNSVSIDLDQGENIVCTFTNKEKGKIIIEKQTFPDGSLQSFVFNPSWSETDFNLTDGQSNDSGLLLPGSYSVEETLPLGWDLTSIICDDRNSGTSVSVRNTADINLEAGETVTCTFNNTQRGSVTIIKNTIGDNGTFTFESEDLPFTGGEMDITTTANTGSETFSNIQPGIYDIEEIVPTGWDLTGLSCIDPDQGSTVDLNTESAVIDLDPGESITCTFTNTKLPTLEIKKILVPSTASGSFNLKIDGTVYANAVGHNGTTGAQIVSIGTHTFSEAAAAGTNMNVYKVVYGGDTGCGTDGSITLAAGENKVCTITNYAKGTIKVTKDVIPDDSSEWDFSLSGPTDGPTSVDDLADNGTYIFSYLNEGRYTLSEVTDDNYVTSIDCGVNGTSNNGTIDLDISWGENAYCTVKNERKGEITVCKYEDLDGNGQNDGNETPLSGISIILSEYVEEEWVVKDTQETSENGCTTFDKLLPGRYKVVEDYTDPDLEGYYSSNSVLSHVVDIEYGSDIDLEFLNTKYRSISGVKFLDENRDGDKDLTEPGLEGWIIYIDTNFNYTYDVGEQTTVTGSDGSYSFEGLVADTYMIGEVLQEGWMQTYPVPGIHAVDLHTAYTSTNIDFGNNIIEPVLEITKLNDRGLSGIYVGDVVTYAIKVRAPFDEIDGTYHIKNVYVIDILPEGFEYVAGSWTGTSTEPIYNGVPAQWYLGDMKEGDEITLTYKAKVSLLQDPGTYKDIVYTYGTSILPGAEDGDVLGLGVYSGDPSTSLVKSIFVGTQVLVIEDPILEEGEVLGASIELPRTGAQTYLTLGAIISMILGFILLVFNPKKKIKTLFLTAVLLLGVFTLVKPTETFALVPEVEVQIEQPASPTKEDTFKIGYVVLDIKDRDIKVQCYVNGVAFGPEYSTNSGDCEVTPSIIISSGTYNFNVIATPDGGTPKSSDTVTVDIVLEKPSPITNYVKTEGVCTYTLTFKTANDGRTSKVEIFRSDTQPFTANASTLIDTLTVGPNTAITYTDDDPLDCSKEYYYAIRALDDLNNFSSFVTDNIIKIVQGTTSTTVTVNGETGQVAGEETTAGEEGEESPDQEEGEDNGEVKGDEDEEDKDKDEEENGDESITSFWNKYKYVIIAAAVVALGSAGYSYVRRKK